MDEQNITENEYVENDELIIVRQLPVIEEQLYAIKERFSAETESALSLVCTEDNLQEIKKVRANLTKVFNALEEKRKDAKKKVLAPYEEFEAIYKECVSSIYVPCNEQLGEKIHEVEERIKAERKAEIVDYFVEYSLSKGIDFLMFDNSGIKISLSSSKKSLKKAVAEYIDKVSEDLQLISAQEFSAEILVEYKSSLNISNAMLTVMERHKAIEAERSKALVAEEEKEKKRVVVETVEKVENEIQIPTAAPADEMPSSETVRRFKVSFSVVGTLEQLKSLKAFLSDGGYEYEQQ